MRRQKHVHRGRSRPSLKKTRRRRRMFHKGGAASTRSKSAAAASVAKGGSSQPGPGPSQCHPSIGRERPSEGCLPQEVLRAAAEKLGIKGASGKDLRAALEEKLGLKKPGEYTFLMALPLADSEKKDIARKRLRPPAPKEWATDPDMWLDSNNIADVLNQYEDAYPHFEFMGPFPIDFAAPDPYVEGGAAAAAAEKKCLMEEICEFRVQEAMKNGTKALGIVYNLDPHFKSGSHWVANYIDIPGHRCYYFDSYGMKPPHQVEKFMKWLTTQDPQMKLEYNARRLQYKNSECGVYCLYFIIRMLEGDSFLDITRRRPKDEDMLDLRDWMFST